jgi:hypothetical protein
VSLITVNSEGKRTIVTKTDAGDGLGKDFKANKKKFQLFFFSLFFVKTPWRSFRVRGATHYTPRHCFCGVILLSQEDVIRQKKKKNKIEHTKNC